LWLKNVIKLPAARVSDVYVYKIYLQFSEKKTLTCEEIEQKRDADEK